VCVCVCVMFEHRNVNEINAEQQTRARSHAGNINVGRAEVCKAQALFKVIQVEWVRKWADYICACAQTLAWLQTCM